MGRVRALIKSCWVGSCRERACDVTIMTIGIPGMWNSRNSGIPVSLHILCKWSSLLNPIVSLSYRWGLCVELYIDLWPIMVKDIPLSLVVSFGSFLGYLCCTGDMSFHVKISFQNSIIHPCFRLY